MQSVGIQLEGVSKTYPNGHVAVRPIDLTAAPGEFLVLVGPSGCGKSTLLRLIAGLETPSSGRIVIGGVDVTTAPAQERDLAMVFQSYALYPHMTVRDNLAYGLKVRGVSHSVTRERVARVADALGITTMLDRRPAQLSGGERQRVALGRAMVREPKAFLFDEPLSNLDPSLRAHARAELRHLHQRLGATMIHVTHDQEEAMTLSGRIAVMREGCIEQVAAPLEIYNTPVNTFVAQFIGAPSMNLLPARLLGLNAPEGSLVGIRPHDVLLESSGAIEAAVEMVEPRGHDYLVHLRLVAPNAPSLVASAPAAPIERRVFLQFPRERLHLFAPDGRRVIEDHLRRNALQ
jgi:ABC-type sugar transport system ATPase subunit